MGKEPSHCNWSLDTKRSIFFLLSIIYTSKCPFIAFGFMSCLLGFLSLFLCKRKHFFSRSLHNNFLYFCFSFSIWYLDICFFVVLGIYTINGSMISLDFYFIFCLSLILNNSQTLSLQIFLLFCFHLSQFYLHVCYIISCFSTAIFPQFSNFDCIRFKVTTFSPQCIDTTSEHFKGILYLFLFILFLATLSLSFYLSA